jgi:putative Holliday junction resolvase
VKAPTRLLGVDFGTVRVGIAVSDADRRIASPLLTYTRKNADNDAKFFCHVAKQEEIAALVIGLPVHMSGAEGDKARQARSFGDWLGQVTGLPVFYWDERLTTVVAESYLQAAGLTSKRRKDRRDRVAAQILLQSYLDAGCPEDHVPQSLEG